MARRRPKRSSSFRMWLHRGLAIVWALLAIPGVLWWKTSILFVILCSLYANLAAELAGAEAADDRELADRLDRIEALLKDRL